MNVSEMKVDGTIGKPAPPTEEWKVTDSEGRQLTVRRLSLLEQLDLTAAAGDLADHNRWFAMASAAACIRDIDDQPMFMLTNLAEIRGHVQRVRDTGLRAALDAMGGFGKANASSADATMNADGSTASVVKN